MDDEKLMKLYQNDDEEAFGHLYEKYSPMVYGFLRKRLKTNEVDDAFQNVWRHLHEKREFYKDQPFAPWFFHMIRNLLIDQYRSAGRRMNLLKSYTEDKTQNDTPDEIDFESLTATLSPDSRDLVRKFYLEGYTYSDLENESGVSQMGLRKRLSRALSQLRKK